MNKIDFQIDANCTSQYDTLVNYIERMDIEKINEILDNQKYSHKTKPEFIKLLKGVFDVFKEAGNTRLQAEQGVCKGCNFGCKGYSFIGVNDNSHLDLAFEFEKDRIKDMCDCSNFATSAGKKGTRINLDPDNFPF